MSKDASPWPTIVFVGLLCGLTLGLVVSLLMKRREDGPMLLPEGGGFDGLGGGINIRGLNPSRSPIDTSAIPAARPAPVARTLTVSSQSPTMILRAQGPRDWKVTVRTLGPTAATATFLIGAQYGNSIVVPAGSSQDMRIPRGEYLYAQGSQAGVCVTVSGGAEA
jgi:hypothetical protein